MSLTLAAEIATLVGPPIAATNVGFTIHKALQSIRPYSKLQKWTIRVQQISAVVAAVGNEIEPDDLKTFMKVLQLYKDARDAYRQGINDGICTWYGRGKEYAEEFCTCARDVFYNGHYLSTEASSKKLESCYNAQKSAVQVPATSTSPLNKGKSRQESSLSEESLLDTAKSSESSTSDSLASSGSCLPNELQTSSSHNSDHPLPSSSRQDPPLYSESEGDNDAISVNLEDDSDCDDGSNDMTLEEVQAVYNFWRQIPEEPSPWASQASFRDKFRRRRVLTKQNRQH